jgi:outer membrane protein assembly factor BamB
VTIDLGDVSAPPPSGTRFDRLVGARPLVLFAVLLVALGLGGSAAPRPQVRVVLISDELPGDFELSRSALFTTGYVGAHAQVRRYALTGPPITWMTELPQPVGYVNLVEAAGVLVVSSPERLQTSFLDSETGDVLWRRTSGASTVLRTTADSALMTSPAGTGGAVVLERVGLRTGATLWTRQLAAGGYVAPGDAASDWIVAVDRRGQGSVLNFTDGSVVSTAEFGVVPDLSRFSTAGGRLHMTSDKGGAVSLTAYRLPDLRRLWQNPTPAVGWPTECGPYLCLSTVTGMTVVDAATGAQGWSNTDWRLGFDSRASGMPGPFRLVVSDARHTLRNALLDPATGQVLAELGDSLLVGRLIVRVDTERRERVWIQSVEPGGDLRTVGSLDGESLERCVAEGDHLACVTRRGRATVWRVEPGR